jgi:hypothetical protein
VRIYSASGELVRELGPSSSEEIPWDVRNSAGEPVATGMYFYEIKNGGTRKKGKIGVLR